MALSRIASSRATRRLFSSNALTKYLDSAKNECFHDPFLQPIERPAVLDEVPEYTVAENDTNRQPDTSQQECFAVIRFGAHQFKVTPDDKIYIEKCKQLEVNSVIHLHRVLVWASRDDTVVGRPFIPSASVRALVEEQCEDATVTIFKKKRRKNYRRTRYHTQELTGVRILSICDMDAMSRTKERKPQEQESATEPEKNTDQQIIES